VHTFRYICLDETIVTLPAHNHRDAMNYECPHMPQTVRLARHFTTNGNVRILMTSRLKQVAFLPLILATTTIKSGN
jgi:hypothetical protein